MKIKWDFMGDNEKTQPGLEDVALKVLLDDDICEEIDAENEEKRDLEEAESRNPFNWKEKSFDFSKRRATDLKGNSRVYFPKKARSLEDEARLEALRVELMRTFRNYVGNFCKEGGKQTSNLSASQARGLKSLKKRVADGEVVIVPTDKSGRLAIMTRAAYMEAGLKHTLKDKLVGWQEIKDSQKELNGHVSMPIKSFRIGSRWDHGARVRETTMGEGLSICPMSLLFKDHKGWSPTDGTAPPTRPVVGGHRGINMHISELVSDILDPVVANYEGGCEIISTEDLIARVEILNDRYEGRSPTSFWGGLCTEAYRACSECVGNVDGMVDGLDPEPCECSMYDGVDEDGRCMVTMLAMKTLRRGIWEENTGWDKENLDRIFLAKDMLPEDVQDQSCPMFLIGTDVANLYPSLDIHQVVDEVHSGLCWTPQYPGIILTTLRPHVTLHSIGLRKSVKKVT